MDIKIWGTPILKTPAKKKKDKEDKGRQCGRICISVKLGKGYLRFIVPLSLLIYALEIFKIKSKNNF